MHTHNWLADVLLAIGVLLVAMAVAERALNVVGYSFVLAYRPARLLDFAVIPLLFAMTLLLRDLRRAAVGRPGA